MYCASDDVHVKEIQQKKRIQIESLDGTEVVQEKEDLAERLD